MALDTKSHLERESELSTEVAALRRKSLATRGQTFFTMFFAVRVQFLLDVRTQFPSNLRNSPIGTQVQLAL